MQPRNDIVVEYVNLELVGVETNSCKLLDAVFTETT